MRQLNLFYIVVVLVGGALFILLRPNFHKDLSFYGFAENNETEINYNYPVVVEQIMVTPGQAVFYGDTLLHLTRRKTKDILDDQNFRIAELRAEATLWRQRKMDELAENELAKKTKLKELDFKISRLRQDLQFKKSLKENLKSISSSDVSYRPLDQKILETEEERMALTGTYDLRIKGLQSELNLGGNPFQEQMKRLTAEKLFEADQQVQEIVVTAPTDGLIGTISCKEEEHIPSYRTLLTFYEPHSVLVKGFVHEDLTLQVEVGDLCQIASLKNEMIHYEGEVIGLGSRIVEIPTRLRKIPEIKTYGREVLIQIAKDNSFLQKEKVSIRDLSGAN